MLLRGHMLLRDHMLRPHAAAVADIMLSRDQPPSHVHRVASKVGVHLDDDSAGVNDVIAWLLRDRCRWLLLDSKPTVSQCQHTASAIRLGHPPREAHCLLRRGHGETPQACQRRTHASLGSTRAVFAGKC